MKTIITVRERLTFSRDIIVENATEDSLEELEDFVYSCDSMDEVYGKILDLDMNIVEYADHDMRYPVDCAMEYDFDDEYE